jgi:hypothetical protein
MSDVRSGYGRVSAMLVTGLEIAIAVAVCAAGVLADQRVRQHWRAATGTNVRAIAVPGPPTSVTLEAPHTRPTRTVFIEPGARAAVPDTVPASEEDRP